LRDQDPTAFDAAMDRARQHTESLRRILEQEGLEQEGLEQEELDGDVVRRAVRSFQAWLESLGVVPEPVRRRIRQIEAAGGAAKISGAGASRGPGAGSILVYHPEPDVLRSPSFDALLGDWRRLDLGLGAPGAQLHRS
jgi:mevalonate kinase